MSAIDDIRKLLTQEERLVFDTRSVLDVDQEELMSDMMEVHEAALAAILAMRHEIPWNGSTNGETRAWHCLRREGLTTFEEAAIIDRDVLLWIPNFGVGSLWTLTVRLDALGISHHLMKASS